MSSQACKLVLTSNGFDLKAFDALIVPVYVDQAKDKSWHHQLRNLPQPLAEAIMAFAKKAEIMPNEGYSFAFDYSLELRIGVVFSSHTAEMFRLLTYARELLVKLKGCGVQHILLDARHHPQLDDLIDAYVAALVARNFEVPKLSGKKVEM